jgi:NADPH2:quinone reductase
MEIPSMMRAAASNRFGPPSTIKVHRLAVPTPGRNELLIRIDVAGVGSWDPAVRDGSWRSARVKFPLVLGTDGSGIVVDKGAQVKRFHVGDRVYAYEFGNPKGGFYAEYVAVKAKHAALVPPKLPQLEAGAAVPVALTAMQGVAKELKLSRGQTVLIFGASGAVGTLAVQFAKARGARVIATASGQRAAALVRRLGADAVVDVRHDDSMKHLRKLAPNGIDAALAFAGGDKLERCLDLMRPGGRVAFPNGIEPGPPSRRKSMRCSAYDLEVSPQWLKRLHRIIAQKRIHVPIAAIFPLSRAADAHRRLARGAIRGRMVLRVRRP